MRQGALFGKRAADVGNKWLLRAVGLRVQSIIGNQEAQSDLPCQGQTLLAVERLFAFAANILRELARVDSRQAISLRYSAFRTVARPRVKLLPTRPRTPATTRLTQCSIGFQPVVSFTARRLRANPIYRCAREQLSYRGVRAPPSGPARTGAAPHHRLALHRSGARAAYDAYCHVHCAVWVRREIHHCN
jgi:hypothetical protein